MRKILSYSIIFVAMLFIEVSAWADNAPAKQSASSLLGRWEMVDSKFYFADGSVRKSTFLCWIEFKLNEYVSECITDKGMDRAVHTYRLIENGKYETKVKENKNYPELVGTIVKSEFRLENNTLTVVTYPPDVKTERLNIATKVESVYTRAKKN
jgi:hypothetical protein